MGVYSFGPYGFVASMSSLECTAHQVAGVHVHQVECYYDHTHKQADRNAEDDCSVDYFLRVVLHSCQCCCHCHDDGS